MIEVKKSRGDRDHRHAVDEKMQQKKKKFKYDRKVNPRVRSEDKKE